MYRDRGRCLVLNTRSYLKPGMQFSTLFDQDTRPGIPVSLKSCIDIRRMITVRRNAWSNKATVSTSWNMDEDRSGRSRLHRPVRTPIVRRSKDRIKVRHSNAVIPGKMWILGMANLDRADSVAFTPLTAVFLPSCRAICGQGGADSSGIYPCRQLARNSVQSWSL